MPTTQVTDAVNATPYHQTEQPSKDCDTRVPVHECAGQCTNPGEKSSRQTRLSPGIHGWSRASAVTLPPWGKLSGTGEHPPTISPREQHKSLE